MRFTWAAHADPPALALKVTPHSGQARGQVLQLCELDLKLSFMALGAQGENIKYQRHPIDHTQAELALKVALLGRA